MQSSELPDRRCSLRRNEKLLIICDPPSMEIDGFIWQPRTAVGNGSGHATLRTASRLSFRNRLSSWFVDLMSVIPLSTRASHVQTRQVATESRVRIASFPEITTEIFSRTMNADWRKIGVNTRKVAGRLSTAKSVRVVNGYGTDFTFQTDDSAILTDDGRLSLEGGFNVLPAGQVCLTPKEGTLEGVVAIDGYFSFDRRRPQPPLILEIQQGIICSIGNHPLTSELEKYFSI